MAEPVLKLAPTEAPKIAEAGPRAAPVNGRKRLRLVLLVVIPLIAAVAGTAFYLAGGRTISTDNAYVGAQKVLITPDVSGKISRVTVREGERVKAGDPLIEIDPAPFRFVVAQAEARLANVRTELASLKSNRAALARQAELARETVALKQKEVDRKISLLGNRTGSQADVDASTANVVAAKKDLEQLTQQEQAIRNQLLGEPDLAMERYPPYMQATAALDQARRDLDHTVLRAPIGGVATQVASIQLGRYVTAGTPVLAIIDDAAPWVDANPKETDVTYLKVGQPVAITVDAFPHRSLKGVVAAVSPGTGAQFAILPPQNASGNWVKVVQRVPVRIAFVPGENVSDLRAGMSAVVEIDTGRRRSLAALIGLRSAAEEPR